MILVWYQYSTLPLSSIVTDVTIRTMTWPGGSGVQYCPLDGWSSSASIELTRVVEQAISAGQELSLAVLRKVGASEATLERTIIIEFGAGTAVFEAISPEGYVVNGEWKRLKEVGRHFK